MKLSRHIRRWSKTRNYSYLWWGIPAVLGCAAWLVFSLCLVLKKPLQAQRRYTEIAGRALADKEFETARVASQRLLAMGVEPRRKHLFDLALSLGGLGRDNEAVSLLGNIAPSDQPGYLPAQLFVAHTLLTRTNVTLQEVRTAEKHLKQVVALDPHSADANELLGRVYVRLGQWELAEKYLGEVVTSRPDLCLMLAVVSKAQGNDVATRGWAERAAKYHREKVEASRKELPGNRLAWADALAMLEDYQQAFVVLEGGWRNYEDKSYLVPLGQIHALWVDSLARSKPRDLASRATLIQRGLSYAPQNEMLLRQLIQLTHLEGLEGVAARDTLQKMLAEGKASAVLHYALAVDAWQRGQPAEARQHFELAYEAAPQLPYVANNIAMILTVGDKPDLPRALAIIESVLQKFPNNPNFRETRGEVLVQLGRPSEAVADLEFALPLLASKTAPHNALAKAYRAMGMAEVAAKHEQLAKAAP
jgi:tetratricopeptide (TPR) repeat protein